MIDIVIHTIDLYRLNRLIKQTHMNTTNRTKDLWRKVTEHTKNKTIKSENLFTLHKIIPSVAFNRPLRREKRKRKNHKISWLLFFFFFFFILTCESRKKTWCAREVKTPRDGKCEKSRSD